MGTTDGTGRRTRWKVPLICLGVLVGALAVPVILVGSGTPSLTAPDAPDRALVVPLPDGSETTLGELLDGTAPQPERETRTVELEGRDGTVHTFEVRNPPVDLYHVGTHHAWQGNTQLAIECLTRIPRSDPNWSRAQRFLGLRVYARNGDPATGVAYVHRAIAADPLEGNAWQDAARVYLARLGIDSQ